MSTLPQWADTRIGRALIAEIIAEQPDYRITRGAWIEGGGVSVYQGTLAARLRRIHSEWEERELAEREQRQDYERESAAAIFLVEQPDALIDRVLSEARHQRRAA